MWYNVCRDLSQNVVKCCRMLWNVTQCIPPFLSLPFLQFLEKSTPPPKECNYDGYGWQEGTPLLGESWSLLIDAYFYLVTSGPRFGTHWFLPWRSWEVLYKVLEDTKNLSEKPCASIILNIRGMPWNFVRGIWKGLWLLQLEQDVSYRTQDTTATWRVVRKVTPRKRGWNAIFGLGTLACAKKVRYINAWNAARHTGERMT